MWVVNVHGDNGPFGGEICVVRDTNAHGLRSCGWYGKDKLCIHSTDSLYHGPTGGTDLEVWNFALKRAQQVCDTLNSQENKDA